MTRCHVTHTTQDAVSNATRRRCHESRHANHNWLRLVSRYATRCCHEVAIAFELKRRIALVKRFQQNRLCLFYLFIAPTLTKLMEERPRCRTNTSSPLVLCPYFCLCTCVGPVDRSAHAQKLTTLVPTGWKKGQVE